MFSIQNEVCRLPVLLKLMPGGVSLGAGRRQGRGLRSPELDLGVKTGRRRRRLAASETNDIRESDLLVDFRHEIFVDEVQRRRRRRRRRRRKCQRLRPLLM